MANINELTNTEDWLDNLDPHTTPARDGRYLRHIREAADAFEDAKKAMESAKIQFDDAVAQARAHGDSWGLIGMVLGVSRQAAQQRFAHVDPPDHGQVTQRVTAKDIEAGRIRLPAAAKTTFPAARTTIDVLVKGKPFEVRWNPRNGPDRARSGVLAFGRGRLHGLIDENEVLSVRLEGDQIGLTELPA